jgi:hypothetical protein
VIPRRRAFGAGLLILAGIEVVAAVLGPLGTGAIHYRTSPTTLNQIVGADAAILVVVAPLTALAAVLALRGWRPAPVLALPPTVFTLYTYAQLVVGQEYLREPGNNERYFPLFLAGFIVAGLIAATAWAAEPPLGLTSLGLRRLTAGVLLFIAGFLVVGLHLSSFVDALRDVPTRTEYLTSPTPFWLVKLMDLGIIVPVAVATAVALWKKSALVPRVAYAVVGGYTLLACSVTGMAVTMWLRDDPDSSLVMVIAFAVFAIALAGLSAALYRPLLTPSTQVGSADRVTADSIQ